MCETGWKKIFKEKKKIGEKAHFYIPLMTWMLLVPFRTEVHFSPLWSNWVLQKHLENEFSPDKCTFSTRLHTWKNLIKICDFHCVSWEKVKFLYFCYHSDELCVHDVLHQRCRLQQRPASVSQSKPDAQTQTQTWRCKTWIKVLQRFKWIPLNTEYIWTTWAAGSLNI